MRGECAGGCHFLFKLGERAHEVDVGGGAGVAVVVGNIAGATAAVTKLEYK
jgi:hypothetical protein